MEFATGHGRKPKLPKNLTVEKSVSTWTTILWHQQLLLPLYALELSRLYHDRQIINKLRRRAGLFPHTLLTAARYDHLLGTETHQRLFAEGLMRAAGIDMTSLLWNRGL